MPRTRRILSEGEARGEIIDTVLLKYEDRCKQQGFVFGGKGTCIAFDFPAQPCLRTDDVLVLDDGRFVEVVADSEPLTEVRAKDFAKDFAAMARLLLALGNAHVPVHVLASRIRVQKRPECEAMVAKHGLQGMDLTAPFEPHDYAHGHHHAHGRDEHSHHHHHGDTSGHHDYHE